MATLAETQAFIDGLATKNLATFMQALGYRESNNDYYFQNSVRAGAYQFERIALLDIGWITSDGGADPTSWI